ncbi:dGTP triphosphohydrolase [Mesorhizobium neociceri]|uniref:DNTP triphosphohydrolase n=1 Tax=Mesorhizobium neociceri TaxID=1307853 RepID=A0A838BAI1_9HYPH|nr:dNTP triphosphohydrolase [Mesorhizobium neociceri]MBA1143465.1 dNTP triphosphohydrolase [Mesorhizobium neociceri]
MNLIWSARRLRVKDSSDGDPRGWRSSFQQDYDRLLFSTPVRRLADKTQVWPMDDNDGVRTRLTHSHEVANLARSIGARIAGERTDIFGADLHDVVEPILSSIGLAHDLGNPPFGHQGEAAIGNWFKAREEWIFDNRSPEQGSKKLDKEKVVEALHNEFLKFDGNPQGLRLVTRLQTHVDRVGLDLTAGTLAALLKYPVSAGNLDETHASNKKLGYFESERDIVRDVRAKTGLSEGQRHPLTWIMEACDDIAYSILDVDDVMKKKIISPDDVLTILMHDNRSSGSRAVAEADIRFKKVHNGGRDADVARDIKIGYLRAFLIEELIQGASTAFLDASEAIFAFRHEKPLMDAIPLCEALKDVAKKHAFSNPAVLKVEAIGASALDGLMSFFWRAISERKDFLDISSRRTSAVAKYGWSLISPNYIEEASRPNYDTMDSAAIRYRELRLLTDMVSGMTDSFALKLWTQVRQIPG